MEYKTTQFTVDELKIEATKIGIKGGGSWHTLWKEYEGKPTDGYLLYQKMGDITGQFVEIEYYEKPNPKSEKYPYKTITKIKPTVKSTEEDIKSTVVQPDPVIPFKTEPDWDRINADKQHSITLAIAMKLAVQSMPAKVKDLDYEEIELRMVKFNAIMEKYLGVVMKEPEKPKFSPGVQKEWDAFHKWLEDNKDKLKQGTYDTAMIWLKGLEKPTVANLLKNLAKIKSQIEGSGEYKSYHDSLITGCCEILKTKDRLPVIQTLNNMVKAWGVEGLEKLSETSENQCLNLVDEFDQMQKDETIGDLPY